MRNIRKSMKKAFAEWAGEYTKVLDMDGHSPFVM